MKKKIESDEIDLIEVIINIWNKKLKIAAITIVFMVLSVALYFILKPPLKAKTEILPITIFEDNLYSSYNLLIEKINENENENENDILNLNEINREYLLSLFQEELQTKEIVIEAIKKYQLIDQSKFNDEDEYLEVVEKYALKLNLLRPINVDGNKRGGTRLNWTIEFEINDQEKWEEALSFIENEINKNIQNYLSLNFSTTLNNLKLLDQFKLEDLNQKIEFAKNDYGIETRNRLAFLNEQASIARELNIKNNTLEVENFNTSSGGVISNLQTAKPYYMRGYSMIEKEIELIESRDNKNKDAFTKNLLDLEKQRRELLENKSLERIERLFNSSPIINGNNFKAASIIYKDTEYEASFSLVKAILISGIFGVIFGMFYVLVSNAIQQRK
ncbi:Wzz/FepE/Etk N-terminal domain-containing protein [Candidatus Pelagibacter sp. HIMB1695]|uniref:Wzz/FepE/Etk N-terminal domain-containing protein n=1 Tax=Candidatus Pelagibacter sp. HIMB1695 TaxID=3413364 RepID=UPI003F859B7D